MTKGGIEGLFASQDTDEMCQRRQMSDWLFIQSTAVTFFWLQKYVVVYWWWAGTPYSFYIEEPILSNGTPCREHLTTSADKWQKDKAIPPGVICGFTETSPKEDIWLNLTFA